MTGVDFSEAAIKQARSLARECAIDARFLVSNVYALPDSLDEEFDIVFTSYGVLFWLPDIRRWAEIAARYARSGGVFYIVESHPYAHVFDDAPGADDLRVRYPYFTPREPLRYDLDSTYAGPATQLVNRTTYEWPHGVGEVLTALVDAGLRIEFLHEFPSAPWTYFPFKEHIGDEMWRLTKHDGSLPLLYSIKATKD